MARSLHQIGQFLQDYQDGGHGFRISQSIVCLNVLRANDGKDPAALLQLHQDPLQGISCRLRIGGHKKQQMWIIGILKQLSTGRGNQEQPELLTVILMEQRL